jgi:hydroxyethylthiazole kinase-like uncharacterized protein yjeF
MQRVTPDRPWPLHDTARSRAIEHEAAAKLPRHELMQRAGLCVARLSLALAPHARCIWLACGPGNNGGDGFEAAAHLKAWGKDVIATWAGSEAGMPADAQLSLQRARSAGVLFASQPPPRFDIAVDALLGLGSTRPLDGQMRDWADAMSAGPAPVLAVDLPSGLGADTGSGKPLRATHTLSLLTLKPGLFTAAGRDASGEVWFDDLGVGHEATEPSAMLSGPAGVRARRHDSHKGTDGDVAIIGGAAGMAGAALLAGTCAVHAGAGRVYVALLGDGIGLSASQPELMFRAWDSLPLASTTVACGCGGGEAVRAVLPSVLSAARSLVLDADALNAIAADTQLQTQLRARAEAAKDTVLTPHPLEAARLLRSTTGQVQSDRLKAAATLAESFRCPVVLKGSGTIIAPPGKTPHVNPTGNARLATGGTGDVLAGLVAAHMARGEDAFAAAVSAVFQHGLVADQWPAGTPLTASALARALSSA